MQDRQWFYPELQVIGAALGWGAQKRATEEGPSALNLADLVRIFLEKGFVAPDPKMLIPEFRASQGLAPDFELQLKWVAQFCERLAKTLLPLFEQGTLPVVVGGDHSVAMGTWSALSHHYAKLGPIGLIWVDAHMDAHTRQTTPSYAIHGMPVAHLLGYGEPVLSQLLSPVPKLLPEHLAYIGVRSFEEGEAALLKQLGVRVYTMHEVQQRGFIEVWQEALAHVVAGTVGFGVSIDLDAFDPEEAPGVGSPEPGGLWFEDVALSWRGLAFEPRLKAIEIVEFNPTLDINQRTAKLVYRLAEEIFCQL